MNRLASSLSSFWNRIQGSLFPFLEEQLDPLTEKQRQLVAVLELIRIETFLPDHFCREGRPQKTRSSIARSFVAKMIYNMDSTRALLERLDADKNLRRICGWESKSFIPSESTFFGYKLHLDIIDGGIPVSALLTSASVHDSQVAIPLATITSKKITNLYDLMDSAYDVEGIHQHSKSLGHAPLIDQNPRRNQAMKRELETEAKARKTLKWQPPETLRYNERTTVERGNARLKLELGACALKVRGHKKVLCHLMFGVLTLAADQLLKIVM